jgi:hypothetical protein
MSDHREVNGRRALVTGGTQEIVQLQLPVKFRGSTVA